MPQYLVVCFWSIISGFVAAGVMASLVQCVTSAPPRFGLLGSSFIMGMVSVFYWLFAGPFIIMRNAVRGRLIEHRPLGFMFISACLAGSWSLMTGLYVVEIMLVSRM